MRFNTTHQLWQYFPELTVMSSAKLVYRSKNCKYLELPGRSWHTVPFDFLMMTGYMTCLPVLPGILRNRDDSPSLLRSTGRHQCKEYDEGDHAFEIEVTEIKHVFKNEPEPEQASYDNIINHLNKGSAEDKSVAEIMSDRKEKVFPNGDAEPI